MNTDLKVLLGITGSTFVGSELIYIFYKWFQKYRHRDVSKDQEHDEVILHRNCRKPPTSWNTVLFFPDLFYPDLRFNGTNNIFPDIPESTTYQFLQYFKEAKISIDICIQLASFSPLEKIIQDKINQGLVVQIVTDSDSTTAHNNFLITQLKRHGFREIRLKNFGYLMHHKFTIIDAEAVLTGSINWTQQAFRGNFENVVVTSNERIVADYVEEFSKLWLDSEYL